MYEMLRIILVCFLFGIVAASPAGEDVPEIPCVIAAAVLSMVGVVPWIVLVAPIIIGAIVIYLSPRARWTCVVCISLSAMLMDPGARGVCLAAIFFISGGGLVHLGFMRYG